MINTSQYGAFNARWLTFESVARTFVPVPQFRQLAHDGHSVLLGPRGCGKTTLLKMLTTRALDEWERSGRESRFQTSFIRPQYEAIYISSDVRWSYELTNLTKTANLSLHLALQAQRIMVTANTLFYLLETVQCMVGVDRDVEIAIAGNLITQWRLSNTLANIADVKATLGTIVAEIRGYLNIGSIDKLQRIFDSIPPSFYGHTLDAPINTINIISEHVPVALRPESWALCYDELEIAPSWLRNELLESLRSTKQSIYLKLTWSPLLPSGLRTSPESGADFKAIRLWHSHVADPRAFCDELTRDFLRDRFGESAPTPDAFFSRSILAAELHEEPVGTYERESTEYAVFKGLAAWDESLAQLMRMRSIDPMDPVPKTPEDRDQFFRKAKPIALLRSEFLSEGLERVRKRPAIYAGKEAVYSMSEGNPRWLRGLLNDFADLGDLGARRPATPRVTYADQARLLNTAGQRFFALIRASPFKPPEPHRMTSSSRNVTLLEFIQAIGTFFHREIYGREFPLDPIGSFYVQDDADEMTVAIIEQLLELGGVVYIGSSPQAIPVAIKGSRFRLSFLLAPIHRLALRTFREAPLEQILMAHDGNQQLNLSFLE